MPIDPAFVGTTSPPVERSWTSADCLLYALAVGAGAEDPAVDLHLTTECTDGVEQVVLPTFGVLLGNPGRELVRAAGSFDPRRLVHAGQSVTLHRPIPTSGTVRTTGTLVAIEDKGSGALLTTEASSVDVASGLPAFTTRSSVFIRGEGGFGGRRPSPPRPPIPDRAPDATASYRTAPNQALLYRLCGDRNPLHADPGFARAAGFDRPILHGLCTFGFAGRALLALACDGDVARYGTMAARFTTPVLPGEVLTVAIWSSADEEDDVRFQVTVGARVVLDDGRFAALGSRRGD